MSDDVKREAVRQMIAKLRESVIVPASDVEHYLPIMGPILDWYVDQWLFDVGPPDREEQRDAAYGDLGIPTVKP